MMARSTRAAPRPAREKQAPPRPARSEPAPPRPPRAKPTPSATPKPDFAKYKDIITDLYWRHDSMSQKKVAVVMAKEHSFFASERQYKKQFMRWGLAKNINKKESEAMYRLQLIRRRRGKESVFYKDGLLLEPARLSRSFKKLEKLGYKPSDEEVVLPPTIRCETPNPLERCRVLPSEEAPVTSLMPQSVASPFHIDEHRTFPEHGTWARSLSPQTEWDVADDLSFGDMMAAPAEADLGRQFSAAPVNHFAFEDPGPYQDFLADFEGPSSSVFGNTFPSGIAPPAQHSGFMRSSPGWETGNYDQNPPQGNPIHLHANGNGIFNSPLHTWSPSPAHTFTTTSFNPPFNPPPTPPPHFDLPAPPFDSPPTPPPTFDLPYTWTSASLPPNNTRAPLYQPANSPSPAYAPASTIPIPRRGLGWRG